VVEAKTLAGLPIEKKCLQGWTFRPD
jgi:hypothetical protein